MTAQPVGIVLVSHSRSLAEGAAEVAALVAGQDVRVVGVGGTDDGRLGTDFDALVSAVEQASDGGGVIVIADLGSAVLTVRTYLDDEDDDRTDRVVLVDAPFVEGAVAAAVAAAAGQGLREVVAAAEAARDVRKLAAAPATTVDAPAPDATDKDAETEAAQSAGRAPTRHVVTLPADLHARPAGEISRLAATFDAEIVLECGNQVAMAVSPLLLMGLGARAGTQVTVRATGSQGSEAVAAVAAALAQIT